VTDNLPDWEPEVRKRYAQPLFVESNEFPDAKSIEARMLPICFEEGIFNGFGNGAPDFMNLATETHVKNWLTRLFASTRSNGKNYVKTSSFKRRCIREEAAFRRGEVRKSHTGLLPVEQDMERNRAPLSTKDVRMSIELGGPSFGRRIPRALKVVESLGIDDESAQREQEKEKTPKKGGMLPPKIMMNGNGLVNGVHEDDDDYGWLGGSRKDRMGLNSILEDCLANFV
jgi:transcriptional coactivator HFI1/ADA1